MSLSGLEKTPQICYFKGWRLTGKKHPSKFVDRHGYRPKMMNKLSKWREKQFTCEKTLISKQMSSPVLTDFSKSDLGKLLYGGDVLLAKKTPSKLLDRYR